MTSDLPPRIVLYDGVCGLCHRMVRWLMAHDHLDRFHYAPLQGDTATRLRAMHPEIPDDLDSVVYVEEGRVHLRSKVFLHAARHLGWPWRWAHHLRWLPAFLLDPLYWIVARVRYRVFGKYESCQLPAAEERERLLP
ncbi:MAG TPA: DCC1-like thiol-disulfide oxidoreductase family protein [Kofleriaceae bacterium]|nr:DCC1-like thiol-disulfide oxidoreductase family protein [Kofleriaceae bacterium]